MNIKNLINKINNKEKNIYRINRNVNIEDPKDDGCSLACTNVSQCNCETNCVCDTECNCEWN